MTETVSVSFGAAPATHAATEHPFATPTRRQTGTPGLVVVKTHYGRYEVWHTGSNLPAARRIKLLRDAIAIGDQLGRYDVDYTQPGATIKHQWNWHVEGGHAAIARWFKSWEHIDDYFCAKPIPAPEPKPLRLIAALCHFCGGDGRGSDGYGPNGDQCMRCWDAYPVLRRRGWCMTTSELISTLLPDQWRELTDRERKAWGRWTSSDAYRNAN